MVMLTDDLLRLWGKTDKVNQNNYHPLLFHLLDVGHVIQRMWRHVLSARQRKRLAAALNLNEELAERFIVLLGAQHDLGKVSAFQRKDRRLWARLEEIGLNLDIPIDVPHGFVTCKVLPGHAEKGIGGWQSDKGTAVLLARITGGHHGEFPTSPAVQRIGSGTTGTKEWRQARESLLEQLLKTLYDDASVIALTGQIDDASLIPLLGGLISVSDWLGSSQKHFPPAGIRPIVTYAAHSRTQADRVLNEFGWTPSPLFAKPASFTAIFSSFKPNAIQNAAEEAITKATEPFLLLVESAMGSGKTEVAFYGADAVTTRLNGTGFYMGLPTQATSNAMFERVEKFLIKRGHEGRLNLQLAHSGALMSENFTALQMAPMYDDVADPQRDVDEEGMAGRLVAEEWFTGNKRTLLAPFGVGTIDQGLLGVLQTRHWFVRLFGLAGKTVIFDEIHAYDVYTGTLLERLVAWLRALDCTVILLSATLPARKRGALLAAWTGQDAPLGKKHYPRMTIACGAEPPRDVPIGKKGTEAMEVPVSVVWEAAKAEAVLARLRHDLPNGGCGAVICNTVANAQALYRCLCDPLEADGWQVRLLHARMPALWRSDREREALENFNRDSVLDRRAEKKLVIATQVLEQSLDLDFDWMASEMAPIDLLLQRLGRLWRHPDRLRATSLRRFVVLCGIDDTGLPLFPEYSDLVYERYILLRSWLILESHKPAPFSELWLSKVIDPFVQSVYDESEPDDLPEILRDALASSLAEMQRRQKEHVKKAEAAMFPAPSEGLDGILNYGSRLDDTRQTLWDDEDPRTHPDVRAATRLGDPSITVICAGVAEDGTELAVLPMGIPTLQESRQLRGFGLPLSQKGLYHALAKQDAPENWKKNSLLRYCRVLEFNNGMTSLAGYRLRLNKNEGLVIEKEGKPTEE